MFHLVLGHGGQGGEEAYVKANSKKENLVSEQSEWQDKGGTTSEGEASAQTGTSLVITQQDINTFGR